MRVRKVKWAQEFLENQEVIVKEPQNYAGHWKELIPCEELHVEIGSGKGDYWIKMSEMYPQMGWIGIEKNESIAALALKKVENQSFLNRRFIVQDASNITEWFGENEIDVIHLNFSDPWPKKRNGKRRLTHANFLKRYDKMLSHEGKIIMKTDNRKLFEFSILEFQNNGYHCVDISLDYRSEIHDEDAITEYENKFMAKGNPIYRGIWQK